ncbi:MAG: tetratricopeptide repeat protein [Bacteroidota bacterium]
MHTEIEKLEHLLAETKNGNAAATTEFFNELWLCGPSLPAAAYRSVVENMYKYIKPKQAIDQMDFAFATLALAFVEFNDGKYESALNQCFQSQKLFSELKDEDGKQVCSVLIGSTYRSMGDMELSMKYLLEAYRRLSESGAQKIYMVFCSYNLAEINSENNQLEDALNYYKVAEKLCEKIGDKGMTARVLTGMGTLCKLQKKYSLALDYLNQASKICDDAGNMIVKARVLTDLGNYYLETGDFENAINSHQQALALRKEFNLPNAQITNLIQLGDIFRKQGKMDDAITTLNNALMIAEQLKVKSKIFQIHSLLSDIYQVKSDSPKCLFHLKAFHQIKDEVQHEDNEKKIKNLHLIFEAEQTQKDNQIIKSQNAEIERKNVQLQRALDELTHTKASRKAKTITLIIAVFLFLLEEIVLKTTEGIYKHDSLILSLTLKCIIILSLKPIETFVESFWLKKFMKEMI